MNDEMMKKRLHRAADTYFSRIDRMPSQKMKVLSRIEGGGRRKVSLAPVLAAMLLLALSCTCVAAGLGLFGQLRDDKTDEMSQHRLGRLEEAAAVIGETVQLTTETNRRAELTVDQAYCDGRKLYYSYRLRALGPMVELLEGMPESAGEWDETYPASTYADVMDMERGAQEDPAAAAWFDAHETAHVVYHRVYVGDGAALADGTYLTPVDSGYGETEDGMLAAYGEVALPDGVAAQDELTFILRVVPQTTTYAQDAAGMYRRTEIDGASSIDVAFTVPVRGSAKRLRGTGALEGSAAEATLHVSDVDVSGVVVVDAPRGEAPEDLRLLAGEAAYPLTDCHASHDGEAYRISLRFDLPERLTDVKLVVAGQEDGREGIELFFDEEE